MKPFRQIVIRFRTVRCRSDQPLNKSSPWKKVHLEITLCAYTHIVVVTELLLLPVWRIVTTTLTAVAKTILISNSMQVSDTGVLFLTFSPLKVSVNGLSWCRKFILTCCAEKNIDGRKYKKKKKRKKKSHVVNVLLSCHMTDSQDCYLL